MRLLIAADIFPPESGGPATYAVTLANEFTKQGDKVTIVSLNPNSNVKVVQCPVFSVTSSFKPFRYWQYYKLLLVKGRDADVIYAMGPVNAGWPALRAARKLGKKFVVKVVGDYAWEQGQVTGKVKDSIDDFQKKNYSGKIGLLQKIERKVIQMADLVITPSDYLKKMVGGWGVEEKKIKVIYNAIKFNIVDPAPKDRNERWVVTVARLLPWKGVDTIIEVIANLKEKIPGLKLKIIGDGPEKIKLENLLKRKKIGSYVEIMGNLDNKKTLSYMYAADLFVLNSSYEGLSHVLVEVLSLGCPVLASDVGGNSEIIKPGLTGELFEYNNKEQLENKIMEFFVTGVTHNELSHISSRNNFFEKFDLKKMLDNTTKVLMSLL